MSFETEHKYLIDTALWQKVVPDISVRIRQGYLLPGTGTTVRVRTKGDKGFITVKGTAEGATRAEYEYEIPFSDAVEMLTHLCSAIIEKTRYVVMVDGHLWEVDVFEGDNAGLVIAEIELENEDVIYTLPEWVKEDVTADMRYMNSSLVTHPYSAW